MSAEKSVTQVKYLDRTANPSYFAQIASGITFVLISLSTLGIFSRGSVIAPIGLFTGILQIVAGIMEWSKGSTFATTIFLSRILLADLCLPSGFPEDGTCRCAKHEPTDGIFWTMGVLCTRHVHRRT